MNAIKTVLYSSVLVLFCIGCSQKVTSVMKNDQGSMVKSKAEAKQLRHVVIFKFKDSSSEADVKSVEQAFSKLPFQIKEISDYEWGINNSPEGLDKGFTHCFLVTFDSEADRAVYLPHPAHLAFVEVLKPHVDDVLVMDYWN